MSWIRISDKKKRIKPVFASASSSSILCKYLSKDKQEDLVVDFLTDRLELIHFHPSNTYRVLDKKWPHFYFMFEDHTLMLDADMVAAVYLELKPQKPTFICGGHPFYYLDGRQTSLILTAAEREEFLSLLMENLAEAHKEAVKFRVTLQIGTVQTQRAPGVN